MKYAAIIAILGSVSALKIEREPLLTWSPTEPASGFKKDYAVPNFGVDHEIL